MVCAVFQNPLIHSSIQHFGVALKISAVTFHLFYMVLEMVQWTSRFYTTLIKNWLSCISPWTDYTCLHFLWLIIVIYKLLKKHMYYNHHHYTALLPIQYKLLDLRTYSKFFGLQFFWKCMIINVLPFTYIALWMSLVKKKTKNPIGLMS